MTVRWLSRTALDAIHVQMIQQYGGSHGVNSESLIDSALARPKNLAAYVPQADLASLAASLAYGLTKNHGYSDGNKRTAFMAAFTFLLVNGQLLVVEQTETVAAMVFLATDQWDEERFANWMREHLTTATGK